MNVLKKVQLKYLVVAIFFIIEIVPDYRTSSVVWWGIIGLLTVVYLLDSSAVNRKPVILMREYERWIIPFYLFCTISIVWARSKSDVWNYIPTLFSTIIVAVVINQMIRTKEDLDFFLRARFFATIILMVYIYLNIDISVLGNERIGVGVLGEGWNSNQIAIKLTIGVLLGMQELRLAESNIKKIAIFSIISGMMTIMLFCGSRTAFIISVFGISINLWLSANNRRFMVTFLVIGIVLLFYNLIMTIPELYDVLGSRMIKLQYGLMGEAESGSGTELRLFMMRRGIQFFFRSPIWGSGMNNFRVLFGNVTGIYYYAHNNYIEILVGFGAIGAILYYRGYVFLIKKGFSGMKKKGLEKYQVFIIGTVLTILLAGMGSVTYMKTDEQLLIMLCFAALKYVGSDDRRGVKYSADAPEGQK